MAEKIKCPQLWPDYWKYGVNWIICNLDLDLDAAVAVFCFELKRTFEPDIIIVMIAANSFSLYSCFYRA